MKTTDSKITADLAIVARASRARPVALATTLDRLGARTEPISRGIASVLAIAPTYASRLATVVAGSYLLLAVLAIFVPLAVAQVQPRDIEFSGTLFVGFYNREYLDIAIPLAATAIIVYFLVWSIALRVCERRLRESSAVSLDRLDRWSLWMGIAAPLAFFVAFGLVRISIGNQSLLWLITPSGFIDYPEAWWRNYQTYVQLTIVVSIVLITGGAFVVARTQWNPRGSIAVAAIVFATVVIAGLRFDGPLHADYYLVGPHPDYTLRNVLVSLGLVSLFVLTAAFVSARRRRELAALDGK